MTQEEAIRKLRFYRRYVYDRAAETMWFPQQSSVFTTSVYGSFLVDELIRKIYHSGADPIFLVGQMYTQLDDVLSESDDDHFVTHEFAAIMEAECGNILRFLQSEEAKNAED